MSTGSCWRDRPGQQQPASYPFSYAVPSKTCSISNSSRIVIVINAIALATITLFCNLPRGLLFWIGFTSYFLVPLPLLLLPLQ